MADPAALRRSRELSVRAEHPETLERERLHIAARVVPEIVARRAPLQPRQVRPAGRGEAQARSQAAQVERGLVEILPLDRLRAADDRIGLAQRQGRIRAAGDAPVAVGLADVLL